MWTHEQLVTDVFTFADLIDMHEILDVKARNEKTWHDYLKRR